MGRMNLIKLNILPRLLYPMQMLPLYITKKRAKERGGVAFPNLIYYNWACHCHIIHDWMHSYLKGGPEPFEVWRCAPHALLAELTNIGKTTGKSHPRMANNLMISNTIKIWKAMSSFFLRGRNSRHI